MPDCDESKSPRQGSPNKHCGEKKHESSKHHHRNKSKSPEKVKCENKHKAGCECKNCQAGKEHSKKSAHFIERFVFTSSTSGILVPFGALFMKVFMLGGGGGGGAFKDVSCENLHGGGGGGAGGSYVKECFPVKCGKTFDVKIGGGGKGGNCDSKDGQDGCASTLTYDSHVLKTANGGKGGSFNLNGGFGGKGGSGTGAGEDGQDGKNGRLCGVGGAGGMADNRCCSNYGNGGSGGSNPSLQGPPPPPSPCPPKHHRHHSRSRSRSPHKHHRHHSHSPAKKPECKEEQCPLTGPNGSDGISGYCEVTFYSDGPVSGKDECCEKIQHIKACDTCTTYWVNPEADVVVVDTSNSRAKLSLGKPSSKSHRIIIKLAYQAGLPADITTSSGGTFTISANNPSVTLFFADCFWDVEDNFQDVHSFYPTTQQLPTHCLDCYVGTQGNFGESVAVSADGKTAVVGASGDSSGVGAAWVYVKKEKCWEKQAKLVGTGAVGNAAQGASVALSADGNTLAVGGPADNSGVGAVWVFTRSGCNWTQQAKLVSTTSGVGAQGVSVALSADGNTLAVGAPGSTPNGLALVWNRSCGNWTQTAALSTSDSNGSGVPGAQGNHVALSADGTVLAVGGVMSVTLYNFSTVSGWSQYGPLLIQPAGPPAANGFGTSGLALSADGYTLAVGAQYGDPNGFGATYVFVNASGVWTQQGVPLQGLCSNTCAKQGFAVALSSDGNTLAVGAPDDGWCKKDGAVFVWTRTDSVWVQRQKLNGPPNQGDVHQGAAVALNSLGSELVVGNYVFCNASPMYWVWT